MNWIKRKTPYMTVVMALTLTACPPVSIQNAVPSSSPVVPLPSGLPSPTPTPQVAASAGVIVNPAPEVTIPVIPQPISGGTCSAPLVSVQPLGSNSQPLAPTNNPTVIKGYLTVMASVSCSDNVASLQYMYRLLPIGDYQPLGGLQDAKTSYSYEINTSSVLMNGQYELMAKVTLKDGSVVMSAPFKLAVDNSSRSGVVSGGGGGGGGGSTTGPTPTPVPTPTPTATPVPTPTPTPTATPVPTPTPGNVSFDLETNNVTVPAGTVRWSLDVDNQISSTPLIDSSGNSFFVAGNSFLAYNANGQQIGSLSLGSGVSASAPASRLGNTIYFGDSQGALRAIDISNPNAPVSKSGFPVTLSAGQQFEFTAPAVDCNGNAYIQTRDRKLMKINADGTSSTLLGPVSLPSPYPPGATTTARYASPVVDIANNRVFVGSQNGVQIAGLDGSNPQVFLPTQAMNAQGQVVSATGADFAINSPLAVINATTAIAISETGTLYNLDPSNPSAPPRWMRFVGDGDGAPVVGSDGTIYVASENGLLFAVDPNTGLDEFPPFGLGNVVEFSSPAIGRAADGTDIIYVGTEGGMLYSITGNNSAQRGQQRFAQNLGAPIRSSITISNDGTVYAGANDGRLMAVVGDSVGLANSVWPKFQGDLNNSGQLGDCP